MHACMYYASIACPKGLSLRNLKTEELVMNNLVAVQPTFKVSKAITLFNSLSLPVLSPITIQLLVLFIILALATPVSSQYEEQAGRTISHVTSLAVIMSSIPAIFAFLFIGVPIISFIVLVGIVIAVTVSISACVYFCIKKSNQQRSAAAVVRGGPVMLVPTTAPVATPQGDSEQKEADDCRQETESGTAQQGPGVVYPPQGVVFASQQGPGGVVYPVPVGYSPQQGVVVVPQQGTTDTPQAAQEQRDAEQEETQTKHI